jgi:hypothetical protein
MNGYTLTTTWNPRGELARLKRVLPTLAQAFEHILVVVPPADLIREPDLMAVACLSGQQGLRVIQTTDWATGRHTALREALDTPATFILYADMDRLVRWVEVHPEEWAGVIRRMTQGDCLIAGRSQAAYRTHPRALVLTEEISNAVVSHLLGKQVDVSAGCKGFSRRAVEYLVNKALHSRALGTDAEWPLLLHKGGFSVDYIEVDGLDWESADRYQERAADPGSQRLLAEAYDADPEHWAQRVHVAFEIVQVALEVAAREVQS